MRSFCLLCMLLLFTGCSGTKTPSEALQDAKNPMNTNADWQKLYPDGYTSAFSDGIKMVLVPAGCFMMGREGDASAEPVHEICFSSPFWIDQTEVTQSDFAKLKGKSAEAPHFTDQKFPVDSITWYEAWAFCEQRGGYLPTEAEWEYAARGVDHLNYPWGDEFAADRTVSGQTSNGLPAAVASHPSGKSWVGAFDMSGNVLEWTSSLYLPYPYNAQHENLESDGTRVLRGNSWLGEDIGDFQSAARVEEKPEVSSQNIGFRCARAA